MKTGICIAALTGLSWLVPAAHAADRGIGGARSQEHVKATDGASGNVTGRLLDAERYVSTTHTAAIDWGTGGLVLQGRRIRSGSKNDTMLEGRHEWSRTIAAGVSGWQGIAPRLAIAAGARVARTRSGFVGGPLLTLRSHAVSQEAYLAVLAADRTGLKVSLFDDGGWSRGNVGDAANRMTNGERRARKGAAFEVGLLQDPDTGGEAALAIRIERAASPDFAPESSATLSLKVKF